jgi:calcineurin-like phosphoesterase family protein/purple acid phosphatase-like protein
MIIWGAIHKKMSNIPYKRIFSSIILLITIMVFCMGAWAYIAFLPGLTYLVPYYILAIVAIPGLIIVGSFFLHLFLKLGKKRTKPIRRKIRTLIPILCILISASISCYFEYSWCWSSGHDRGPYLSWVDNTSTTMTISIDPISSGGKYTVNYGLNQTILDKKMDMKQSRTHFSATLRDLSSDTKYYYTVQGFANPGEIFSFRTAPSEGQFVFTVYGDTREDPDAPEDEIQHDDVIHQILNNASESRFLINTGDIAQSPTDTASWDYHFNATQPLSQSIPYMPVVGNHDANYLEAIWGMPFHAYFELPEDSEVGYEAYEFSVGNAFFLNVHQNIMRSGDYEDWMIKKIEYATNNYDWVFVSFHHPMWSRYRYSEEVLDAYYHIFDKYGITAVFNGHNHFYERTTITNINTITHIVTGGGGAPLYPASVEPWDTDVTGIYHVQQEIVFKDYHFVKVHVDSNQVLFETIALNGTLMDSFTITS